MSTTTLGSVVPSVTPHHPGFAVHRRLVSMLLAALLGLALAFNPVSAPKSEAAEVPLSTSLAALGVARAQIGVPYRYGGTTPAGFDCSGLTQYSYARVGSSIPRTAQLQYNATIRISWDQRRLGDLVFFYSGSSIYHVGIYAGNWSIVVAPHTGTLVQVQTIQSTNVLFGRVKGTGTSTPAPVAASRGAFSPGDFTGDHKADILGIKANGDLSLYRGNGAGGFAGAGTKIGAAWGIFTKVFSTGDFTGDAKADILGIKANGDLSLYRGNGAGGFAGAGTKIGTGWAVFTKVFSTGDFTGDAKADILAIKANGDLSLYRGNGAGGFAGAGTRIGTGWAVFTKVFSNGDFTGDRRTDILSTKTNGDLCLYRGNGAGGFTGAGTKIGVGWGIFARLFGNGDFTGDTRADVLGITSAGSLVLFRGSGLGWFTGGGTKIGAGWGAFL